MNGGRPLMFLVPLFSMIILQASAVVDCGSETVADGCRNQSEAFKLKLIAIPAILVTSMVGVSLPILARSVPSLHPDRDVFLVIKCFASGVILATGCMHVLPDSMDSLGSDCLPEKPWKKFPFSALVFMLSALFTLAIDSFAMSFYKRRVLARKGDHGRGGAGLDVVGHRGHGHGHGRVVGFGTLDGGGASSDHQLIRYRIVAQVLEVGIVVHSVVIGVSYRTSESVCTLRPLLIALCFRQFFEGMGLGGSILQADYGAWVTSIMVAFFSITTPSGIALGMALSKVYSESSPTALIMVGLLDTCSAGLLEYTALVDLLAANFLSNRMHRSLRLHALALLDVLLGAGFMALVALWA
ncbi:fe(2+) transport protein 1 [Andrographis paniculata]|uniref:fe(2+) transport protein 1 n=1 Tax=Andrographis paniculata TaxID=175694 RepID=UPI0021E7CE7A|nr:fe(2+) transport protein 1 [Andrographis paniculata]